MIHKLKGKQEGMDIGFNLSSLVVDIAVVKI